MPKQDFFKWNSIVPRIGMVYDLSGNNAFMSVSRGPGSRPIPGIASGYRLNGSAPPFEVSDTIIGQEITYTTHQLPAYPQSVYDSCSDCVNAGVFDGRPVGTVLYRGPQTNTTSNLGSANTFEVAHQFAFSRIPWNKYFLNGALYDLTRADGTLEHTLADLTAVFSA